MAQPNPEQLRLRRSLLFVPGAEPRKLERARDAAADTVLLDLEDSVAPAQKEEARQHVAAALQTGAFGETEVAVRVNSPGTPYFEADLEAMTVSGSGVIMLPKSASAEQLVSTAEKLETLEQGLGSDKTGVVRLLALVETPAGIANAWRSALPRRGSRRCASAMPTSRSKWASPKRTRREGSCTTRVAPWSSPPRRAASPRSTAYILR